jgi:hypothetical protein
VATVAALLRVWRRSIVAENQPLSIGRQCIYFVLTPMGYSFDYFHRVAQWWHCSHSRAIVNCRAVCADALSNESQLTRRPVTGLG